MGVSMADSQDCFPARFDRIMAGLRIQTDGCIILGGWQFGVVSPALYPQLEATIHRVRQIAAQPSCATFFQTIGKLQSLEEILDSGVGISYLEDHSIDGVAAPFEPVLALTSRAFAGGSDLLEVTLIHELSHLGGIRAGYWPNDASSHFRAYQAEVQCTSRVPERSDDFLSKMRAFSATCGTCMGGSRE
jgi:hypothetical protein